MTMTRAVDTVKSLTWNAARKLGIRQIDASDIERLRLKLHPGLGLEMLIKSEYWPDFLEIMQEKNKQALDELSAEPLTNNGRIRANARATLVAEIINDIDNHIKKAQKAKTELDKIKESQNVR